MSYENFSWAKTSVALSQVLKQLKKQLNIAKEAIKQRLIDVRITWLSNYKKLKLDTWIGHHVIACRFIMVIGPSGVQKTFPAFFFSAYEQ